MLQSRQQQPAAAHQAVRLCWCVRKSVRVEIYKYARIVDVCVVCAYVLLEIVCNARRTYINI